MSERLLEGAHQVAHVLRSNGYQAYFAGGCVRDLLLGHLPKDYDIVTDAKPEEVCQIFPRTIKVGAAFGVVRVLWTKRREYEVATFRTEVGYSDGRRPDEIRYSSHKEEDVARRDFTINALLMDPETQEVIDLVGGRADLEQGLIRAVGSPEERFFEDKLRMLRAVRFAARFGFAIHPDTRSAIRAHAPDIGVVSAERIATELEWIWTGPRPGAGFVLLHELGLASTIMPFLEPHTDGSVKEAVERLERLPACTADLGAADRLGIAWAAILHPVAPPVDSEDVLRGLKLSRDRMRTVARLLDRRRVLLAPTLVRQADRVRVLIDLDAKLQLAFLEVLLGPEALPRQVFRDEASLLAENPIQGGPVLTGKDLLALGLTPGPEFKAILEQLEVEVLERRIRSKDEALAWVQGRLA